MADLGTLALGTFTNVAETAIQGSDPVLEVIASTDDTDYVYDATNSTHTGTARFALGNTPADLGNVDTLSIKLRYAAAAAQTNVWDSLSARVFKSDGTTALTNAATVALAIITTTITDSAATAFTGVDTAATKADWDGAVVHIIWGITKVKGGDTVRKNVYAAEITGTYTASANEEVLPGTGAATFAGFAPTVAATANTFVSAGIGAATFTGFAPAVATTQHQNVTPGLGAAVFVGFSPSIVASDHRIVLPGVGVCTFAGFAPTIAVEATSSPNGSLKMIKLLQAKLVESVTLDKEPRRKRTRRN